MQPHASSEHAEPMSRLGITQTSSLSSPPHSPVQNHNCIYSRLSLHSRNNCSLSSQCSQSKSTSRFAALYTHRKMYTVLTTALIQFYGETSLIRMTITQLSLLLPAAVVFSMLTRCTHLKHTYKISVPAGALYFSKSGSSTQRKKIWTQASPPPFSLFFSYTIFLLSSGGGGRVHTVSTQKCMTLKWQAKMCKKFRAALLISLSPAVCEVYFTSRPW